MSATRFIAAALLVLGLAAPSLADAAPRRRPAPAPVPPAAVLEMARAQLAAELPEANLPPRLPARAFHAVNISADGVADWRVNGSEMGDIGVCDEQGCQTLLIVSQRGGGYAVVFDLPIGPMIVTANAAGAIVDVSLDAQACRSAQAECSLRYQWDARTGRLVERPNARGVTRWDGPLLQPVRADWRTLPPDVAVAVRDMADECRQPGRNRGDSAYSPTIANVPDVNGDGVRDWIIGSAEDSCPNTNQPLGYQILVSTANGRFQSAFEATGLGYAIDLTPRGTRVIAIDVMGVCPEDTCFEEPLRWNPTGGFSLGPNMQARERQRQMDMQRQAELGRQEAELRARMAELDRQQQQAQDAQRRAEWERQRAENARRQADLDRQRADYERQRIEEERRRNWERQQQQNQQNNTYPGNYNPGPFPPGMGNNSGYRPPSGNPGTPPPGSYNSAPNYQQQQADAARRAEEERRRQEQLRQQQLQQQQQQDALRQQQIQQQQQQQAEEARRQEQLRQQQQAEAERRAAAARAQEEAEERAAAQARAEADARRQAAEAAAAENARQLQEQRWQSFSSAGTIESYQAYLDAYPNGPHADEARNAIKMLQQQQGQ